MRHNFFKMASPIVMFQSFFINLALYSNPTASTPWFIIRTPAKRGLARLPCNQNVKMIQISYHHGVSLLIIEVGSV